jgi:hypothetical protein
VFPSLPKTSLPETQLNFTLVLQDIPGPHGHPLPQTSWQIVQLKSTGTTSEHGNPALDPDNWRKVLASGCTAANGECVLTPDQRQLIWQQAQNNSGALHVVYDGLNMPLDITTLAATPADTDVHQTLSASNYMARPGMPDQTNVAVLRHWIQDDHQVSSIGKPKSETSL